MSDYYRLLLSVFIFFLFFHVQAQNPEVSIHRDDLVATVYMDYNEYGGSASQLWEIGTEGTDPCGYLIEWWPDTSVVQNLPDNMAKVIFQGTDSLVYANADHPYRMVTPNRVVQIQPIANNSLYHLRVSMLNGLGQISSETTEISFNGGNDMRVNSLRTSMTFFDDFNLPMGPADERKWNNAMTPQTDPRFNLFFINPQYHTHTLNGTLNGAAGDKSQVAQRARKSMLVEESVRRRIVFDMDGIFSPRSVWYLDLNPVKTDLTGHMSFFDFDGDTGLPADVLRLRAVGHELSVNLINSQGASKQVGYAYLPDYGRAMAPNVRRSFDVRVGVDGVTVMVDDTTVIDENFQSGEFKTGIYDLLWSTIGYNTSKDDNPYFLSHWDNFGFDGPDIEPFTIHNYVTRIAGTDLQKSSSWNESFPTFSIIVPDDIRPVVPDVVNQVYLVFTYMKNDFSYFDIQDGDYLLFNGESYPLPQVNNNTTPLVPGLVDYSGSAISNRIKIGEARYGEPSPVIEGENLIQFFATNTGIVNVHLEVLCPNQDPSPPYTPPSAIHPFVMHGDLPKLGMPAKITFINDEYLYEDEEGDLAGPELSDTAWIDILVGNRHWADWGPHLLHMPASSAEFWSIGSTAGIKKVDLYLKSDSDTSEYGQLAATLHTNADAPAPQLRYSFPLDTRAFPNGTYDLFLQATDSKGIKSHPSYGGFAFRWDASELSGAYEPVKVEINNIINGPYVFHGEFGPSWTENESWQSGNMPPLGFDGWIDIDADCELPGDYPLNLGKRAVLRVKTGNQLLVKKVGN